MDNRAVRPRRRWRWVAFGLGVVGPLALALGTYACSTSEPPAPDAGADTGIPLPPIPPLPPPFDAAGDAARDTGVAFDAGTNLSAAAILINEISGGDEWVELVNSGAAAEDLGGLRLADRDKATGEPKLAEAVTFPPATVLARGEYLLVRGGGAGDGGRACPDGGQRHCFNAEFGISNKSGETLFLLAADGGTLGKVVYPPDASSGSRSYARIPSGEPDASFQNAPETPGAPNVP
ncbi:MAG: lamin tail domain-containing protein [Myxococcales bacterium]|nr:lamin tail domain-containing protein [Myxococcales bacterium]